MRGVDFDTVETGGARASCGGDMGRNRFVDARLGHLLRDDGFESCFIDRMRNCGWRYWGFAANIDAGMAAGVTELDRDFGAAAMDRVGQAPQSGNEAIVVNSDFAAPMPSDFFRRGHFDRDQPSAAAHARQVIGEAVIGDEALVIGGSCRHRRHDDAVFDFDRTDASRGEQDVHWAWRFSMQPQLKCYAHQSRETVVYFERGTAGRLPALRHSSNRCTTTNSDGTNRIARQVEAIMPLNTVMPIDLRALAPAPLAITSGATPRMNANEVIKIGRSRAIAPSTAASNSGLPSCTRCSRATSTIRIAFLAESAMSKTMPIWV